VLGHRGTHRAAARIASPPHRVSTVAVVIVASNVSTTRRTTRLATHQVVPGMIIGDRCCTAATRLMGANGRGADNRLSEAVRPENSE
jgi:hypothetical protein